MLSITRFTGVAALAVACCARPALADSSGQKPLDLTTIDITPSLIWSTCGDEQAGPDPTNPFVQGDGRLNARLTEQLARHLSPWYFHNSAAAGDTAGSVTDLHGAIFYPGGARDVSDEIGADSHLFGYIVRYSPERS